MVYGLKPFAVPPVFLAGGVLSLEEKKPDTFERVGDVTVTAVRCAVKAIDTAPVTAFNQCYLDLINEPTMAHGLAMQAFLANSHNQVVLQANAAYQIPPYQGADFAQDWWGAQNTLNNWIEKGAPSEGPYYTMLCEFINNVHYWCPHPLMMLGDWNSVLAVPSPVLSVLVPYAALFCENPYNKQLLGLCASENPTPLTGTSFVVDWMTAQGFVHTWSRVLQQEKQCVLEGPLYAGVVGIFQRLGNWCGGEDAWRMLEPVQAKSLNERFFGTGV
jgi:hypothetical protein